MDMLGPPRLDSGGPVVHLVGCESFNLFHFCISKSLPSISLGGTGQQPKVGKYGGSEHSRSCNQDKI